MAQFTYDASDFNPSCDDWGTESFQLSEFDKRLRDGWDKAVDAGQFRYKLDIEETKILGEKQYVAQLNIKRAQERRKPDTINTLNQPFNPASFNFTKIKEGEILFQMVKLHKSNDSVADGNMENGTCDQTENKRHLVIINVSPLEYGHILLVPDVDACRPQVLTEEVMQLSIESMLLSRHRGFRVGFNSLCAFASVNHLHMHAYYLDRELFVESAPVEHICDSLYELNCMPVTGFAFQLHGCKVDQLSRLIFNITDFFQKNEIAHNIFMTRGTVFGEGKHSRNRTIRIYLWPRKKFIGLKEEEAFNVALVELAGHLPIKVKELFDESNVEKVEATMREVALDMDDYNSVKQSVIQICKNINTI